VVHLLGILAVWAVVEIVYVWVDMPRWAWIVFAIVLGCGWELLVEPSTWWYGVGVGGGAKVLGLITVLLAVSTDSGKLTVLRHSRGRM
jgi:hypothetical protein